MCCKLFSRLSYTTSILINFNEEKNKLILKCYFSYGFSMKNNSVLKGLIKLSAFEIDFMLSKTERKRVKISHFLLVEIVSNG